MVNEAGNAEDFSGHALVVPVESIRAVLTTPHPAPAVAETPAEYAATHRHHYAAPLGVPAVAEPAEVWRHVKTGGLYRHVAHALREEDCLPLVVYQEAARTWVRPASVFYDGRFERVHEDKPAVAAEAGQGERERLETIAFEATNNTDATELCKYWWRKGFDAALAAQPAPPSQGQWPKARDVKVREDMGEAQLRVLFDSDNDVIVELWAPGQLSIAAEFCNGMSGGGKSPKTRMALIALMCAIEADAAPTQPPAEGA
jgi:hypothetical protein